MKGEYVGYAGSSFTAMLALIQSNEIFQIVEIILACISFLVSIAYTIYKWRLKAKDKESDGGEKITKKEVNDLIQDLQNIKDGDDDDRD